MSKPKPLTPKQEAFVLAYVKTGNASEAYREAYNTKASAKTIHEKSSRLLAEGKVRARFEESIEPLSLLHNGRSKQ
jgi:phage terminase small subunit